MVKFEHRAVVAVVSTPATTTSRPTSLPTLQLPSVTTKATTTQKTTSKPASVSVPSTKKSSSSTPSKSSTSTTPIIISITTSSSSLPSSSSTLSTITSQITVTQSQSSSSFNSSTVNPPTTSSESSPNSNSPSVVGPVVGTIAGLVVIGAFIAIFVRRKLRARRALERYASGFGRHYEDTAAVGGSNTFGDGTPTNPWGISAAAATTAAGLGAGAEAAKRYSHRRSLIPHTPYSNDKQYQRYSQYEGQQRPLSVGPTSPQQKYNGSGETPYMSQALPPYTSPAPTHQQAGYNNNNYNSNYDYNNNNYYNNGNNNNDTFYYQEPAFQAAYTTGGSANVLHHDDYSQDGYSNAPHGYPEAYSGGYSNAMYDHPQQQQDGDIGDYGSPTMGHMDPAYNSHVAYNNYVYGNNGASSASTSAQGQYMGSHENSTQMPYYNGYTHSEMEEGTTPTVSEAGATYSGEPVEPQPRMAEQLQPVIEEPPAESLSRSPPVAPRHQQPLPSTSSKPLPSIPPQPSNISTKPNPTSVPFSGPTSHNEAVYREPGADPATNQNIYGGIGSDQHYEMSKEQLTEENQLEEKAMEGDEEDGDNYGVYGGLALSVYGLPSNSLNPNEGENASIPPLPATHTKGGRDSNFPESLR